MGGLSPGSRRPHIWFAEGCLPGDILLEKAEAGPASAESRHYRAARREGDNMI